MPLLPQTTLNYFEDYRARLEDFERAATEAHRHVEQSLKGQVTGFHAVESRAKHPISLLDKLRRKEYKNPEDEVKDLIGVRVVTNYPDDAELVAALLRPDLDVDDSESYDRLDHLDANEFDYRAIHLVARLPAQDADVTKYLKCQWFEIQVRSLLQHAWATIEHEIKYKSGVDYPPDLTRRLAAIAGSLETLDQAFLGMRSTRDELIDDYRGRYSKGEDEDITFDSARLIAFLEVFRREGLSFRGMGAVVPGGAVRAERIVRDALIAVGVQTPNLLRNAAESAAVKRALKKHAAAIDVAVDELSHLILCLMVVWDENPDVLLKQYPELLFDSELADTLGFDVAVA